jgi:hypothetical protein
MLAGWVIGTSHGVLAVWSRARHISEAIEPHDV